MAGSLNWAATASAFLKAEVAPEPVHDFVSGLRDRAPLEIDRPIEDGEHPDAKNASAAFLVMAVRNAVEDHALSEREVHELRHVARALRIEEGDLLKHRQNEVVELLCQELERLLEDRAIDPSEAVHKVKLQEVLGLSYDEFLALTAPEVDRVVLDLLYLFGVDGQKPLLRADVAEFRSRLAALDTVYDFGSPSGVRGPGSGYLYLLANPAMPGLVKIGWTSRQPTERVSELTSATGVPSPFVLVYDLFVQNAQQAESWVHARLSERGLRTSENREFFTVSPSDAVEIMMEARDIFRV